MSSITMRKKITQQKLTKRMMMRVMIMNYQAVMMDTMKMIKIDICDIRIIFKVWTHTYRKRRLCHAMAWMN